MRLRSSFLALTLCAAPIALATPAPDPAPSGPDRTTPIIAAPKPGPSGPDRSSLTAIHAYPTASTAAASKPIEQADAPLQTYSSRFYTVHTDLTPQEARDYAAHMDAVFAEYDRRFASFRPRSRRPMPLYLFRHDRRYIAFLGGHGVNATNSGGMFIYHPGVSGLLTFTSDRSRSETFTVLQHEGFHQFAFAYIGPELPIWANEGLAQYFEDGILVKGQLKLGRVHAGRLASVRKALDDDSAVDFDQLLNITSEAWHQTLVTDPQKARLLYDQSWSIVHFLVHADDGRYRPAFENMLQLIAKGGSVDRAFRKAFGSDDTTAFKKRWIDYVRAVQPDPLTNATQRMEFIAQALRFLHQRGEKLPADLAAVRQRLLALNYRAWRESHGVRTAFAATDDTLFQFALVGGVAKPFILLEPARDDLPPRVAAPGLSPEPTVTWSKDPDGQLVSDIEYR